MKIQQAFQTTGSAGVLYRFFLLLLITQYTFLQSANAQCSDPSCLTDQLIINTGYDYSSGTSLSPSTPTTVVQDPFWLLISAPTTNGPVNLNSPAFVIETHPAWDDMVPVATPPSRYISAFSRAGNNEANISGTPYIFERKICICEATQVTFEENLHVDNQAVLRLYGPNLGSTGVLLSSYNTTTVDNFRYPPENDGPVVLNLAAGTYSLQAEMRNDNAGSPMGLNIQGTLIADKVAISDHTCCNNGAFVSGFKFLDANCNGVQESTENLGDGWTITLFDALGTPVATTTTDASGYYFFNITTPGTYTVEETPSAPWIQTFPVSPNSHSVTITGTEVISNLNFGNCCPDCLTFQNNAGNIAFTCTSDGLDVSVTVTAGLQPGDTWSVDLNNDKTYEITNIPYGQTATYTFPHAGPFNLSIKAVRLACGEPCEVFLSKSIILEENPCINSDCYAWNDQSTQFYIYDMCTFNGEVIVGGQADNDVPLLASWDGNSWQDYPGIPIGFDVVDVEALGGYLYAMTVNKDFSNQQRLYRLVGNLWVPVLSKALNSNFPIESEALVFLSDLVRTSAGLFVAFFQDTPNAGGSTSHELSFYDGITLSSLPAPSPVGTGTTINYYMIGQYQDEPLVRVDQLDGSFIGTTYLATWDGASWAALTAPFTMSTLNPVTDNANGITVATQQGNDLILGGSFTSLAQASPVPGTTGIARWSPGGGFQSISGGETSNTGTTNNPIHITGIEVLGDNIFVGGFWVNALGGVAVNNSGWFDGTNWHAFNNLPALYIATVATTGAEGQCEVFMGGEIQFGKAEICCEIDDLVLSQTETSSKVYHTDGSITSTSTIAAGADIQYKAGNGIFLTPPFSVAPGASFSATVEGCEECCPSDPLNDLPWLAPFVNNNNYAISQCMYNGNCIYQISDFCQVSDGTITYYDCSGNVICEQFQFGGTCSPSFSPTNCVQLQACPPLRGMSQIGIDPESNKDYTDIADIWVTPNPIRDQAIVDFYLPIHTEVLLELRDLNGLLLQTIQAGRLAEGRHRRTIDTSARPAGMYLIVLTAGSEMVVKRIVVLR